MNAAQSFVRTRAAFHALLATEAALDACTTDDELTAALAAIDGAMDALREALYADTAAYNDRETILTLYPPIARELAESICTQQDQRIEAARAAFNAGVITYEALLTLTGDQP